jgi:ParB family transcriptional regulator, chromosome partitioning protein
MARKGGLGKGLDALIPGGEANPAESSTLVAVGKIVPNPFQPRGQMDPEGLTELADSIREHGVLQPLLVTQDPGSDQYILIAGERRLEASKLAGLEMVPVILREVDDRERLELALIENIQRSDLSPLETAEAYRLLAEDFGLSHEEIAAQVGKNRVTVTNTLRLLNLSDPVRTALNDHRISEGHARALLGLNSPQAQNAVLAVIIKGELNVRQAEDLVRKYGGEKPVQVPAHAPTPEIQQLEEDLRQMLGTKVTLRYGKKGGTLTIHYYSDEELEHLISRFRKG